MRSYPPEKDQPHVVALYTRSGDAWQQLAMQPIGSADNPDDLGAGYIDRGGVHQVTVEPQGVWLQVDAVVGAHSGTLHLLRYAGGQITVEAANTSASPGSGYVADLNGDGLGDVVLDASDAYVFCYACGVRYVDYSVLRWDGDALVPVELSLLPESAPAALRDANNKAVILAQLNLWQDALNQLAMVAAQNQADDTGIVGWNVALIHLIGEARREAATQDIYPILQQLFYGDYVAAVAPFRTHPPAEVFAQPSALVQGTVAEGWEDSVRSWVFQVTDPMVESEEVGDDVKASAHFLRAWAAYVVDPADPAVGENMTQTTQLAPDDAFFNACASYLESSSHGA